MKDITIRTEVAGLELNLQNSIGEGMLQIIHNGVKLAWIPLEQFETNNLSKAFRLKDEPGMNWFDTVLATVGKAVMPTPKKEIRKQ